MIHQLDHVPIRVVNVGVVFAIVLSANLRAMSVMDYSALPSMPSERCHKPPQKPPTGRAVSWPKVVLYPTLQTLDGLARHTPVFGDSTGRETVAQPLKDRQPFQARQWLAVGGLGRKFTQSFQFFRYWRFFMNRWLVPFWGFVESLLMPL